MIEMLIQDAFTKHFTFLLSNWIRGVRFFSEQPLFLPPPSACHTYD